MTLRPRLPGPVALLGLALVGCGGDADPPAPTDAGRVDRPAVTDRGPVDATADASADVLTTDATVPGDAASDAPAVDTGPAPVDAGRDAQVQVQCAAFGVEPARVRIATGAGVQLQPVGGSGRGALFTVREGSDTGGATLNVGGGLVAGPRAARFQVQAVDLLCPQQRASVEVEVVGPFEVEPAVVRVAPLRTLNFVARGNVGAVRWDILIAPPSGTATVDAMTGRFNAGAVLGNYRLRARDTGSGNEVQVAVTVATVGGFTPKHATLLVPQGQRVRIDAEGGSGAFDAMPQSGPSSGRLVQEAGRWYFDAMGATAGTRVVALVDRYTQERTSQRIVVGEELAPVPLRRGGTEVNGAVALGDLNGDGRTDLVVGHPTRSRVANFAGGVLVYYGRPDGRFATPDLVLEGERENDRLGAGLTIQDVDGDGIDDLVAAAPTRDLGRDSRGAVSVHLGSRMGLVAEPERTFAGEALNDQFGAGVVLRDLDGDGAQDMLVVAPNASNPFATTACRGAGRVFVYHGVRGARGLFTTVPWQVVELRDRLTDTDGPPECRAASDAGKGLALFDLDGDGRDDLVVGAPGTATTHFGSVLVYRRGTAMDMLPFATTPSWVIHPEMSLRTTGSRFGGGLDVVPTGPASAPAPVLVVRAPTLVQNSTQTGGFFVFGSRRVPAPLTNGDVRVVMSDTATARFVGGANEGVGRSGLVLDLDGDSAPEYLVGGASGSTLDGAVHLFPARALAGTGTLTATATARGTAREFLGLAMAGRAGTGGLPGALAVLAGFQSTGQGYAMGAVRWAAPAVGNLTTRMMGASTVELPGFAAFDRSGTAVALTGGNAPALVVGSPGAHSPAVAAMGMTAAQPAAARPRVGAIDVFPAGASVVSQRAWVARDNAQYGAVMTTLDFDGDGLLDLAVGEPGATAGGNDWVTRGEVGNALTDRCFLRTGTTVRTASIGGRGMVRIYLQVAGGGFVERFRAIAQETVPTGGTFRRGGFGGSLALGRADVDGDGRDDLVVGRAPNTTTNGAEVVLGRTPDAMGRVLVVCNDPTTAPRWDDTAASPFWGRNVAAVGDLDNDGCDETAANIDGSGRASVLVQFGFGSRCRNGHTAPYEVHVVADDRNLRDNVAGMTVTRDNDLNDVAGGATGFGALLHGGADLTGDNVPDLVARDNNLLVGTLSGPAVEIISGAAIVAGCPNRACTAGVRDNAFNDGDYHAVGVRTMTPPRRFVVPSPMPLSVRFATALGVGDLDGDGTADLFVGAADDNEQGAFAGAVMAWRGSNNADTFLGQPWLYGVGDVREMSLFGLAVAVSPLSGGGSWVAVGAPQSGHRGAQTGAAYRWRIER
jgi:hypothetical protein